MTSAPISIFDVIEKTIVINEEITIYVGKINKDFFKQYILQYDNDFYEPLSKRVDMDTFSDKINKQSTTFVLVYKEVVAGLIASYFYDLLSQRGFITLVHTIREFRGKHLAARLVEAVKVHAKSINFHAIDLVVYKDNVVAYKLYLSNGFNVLSEDSGRCVMRCKL